jgi:hypothetical protein
MTLYKQRDLDYIPMNEGESGITQGASGSGLFEGTNMALMRTEENFQNSCQTNQKL